MLAPTLLLAHGARIPSIGFGIGIALREDAASRAVGQAIEAGYRMFACAERYENERGVGNAIRDSGVARNELFVDLRVDAQWHGSAAITKAVENALIRFRFDYIDLLTVSWPHAQVERSRRLWEELVELLDQRVIHAVGTSEFTPVQLDRLIATGFLPDVNQLRLNPRASRGTERAYHRQYGIATQAYSPFGDEPTLLVAPSVLEIARRHKKTAAQIVLRWILEIGAVPIVTTSNRSHMRQNLEIFDFELTPEEVEIIGVRGGERYQDATDTSN